MWSKLVVNMADASVSKLPYDEQYLQLGGRALIANYFMDLVKTGKMDPRCDPMGEQNVLMFCTGVLAGTNFTTSHRISVGCKSPLTGGIKEASSGGYMGKLLADQGLRMVTVHGLPTDGKLRYLHIGRDGSAELVDAEELRFKGTWMRLTRRAVRDHSFRGTGVEATLDMWANVRRGEKLYISPYKEKAHIMFDSSLPYEVSVMKNYARPLLAAVPEENARRHELLDLIAAFDHFEPIDPALVPANSLLREFIGGGSYQYS